MTQTYTTDDIISVAIATKNPEIIVALLDRLLNEGDCDSVRELLTQAMVAIDIENITENPQGGFLNDVLRGDGWRGYNDLTYEELVYEFESQEETQEILFMEDNASESEYDKVSLLIRRASNLNQINE